MLKFLKKIFKKDYSAAPGCSKDHLLPSSNGKLLSPRTTQAPPPSYEDVLREKIEEILFLEDQLKSLEQSRQRSVKRYLHSESLFFDSAEQLDNLGRKRKNQVLKAIRKGQPIPSGEGFRLCYRIMREELEYLDRQRESQRQKMLKKLAEQLRCRSRLDHLKARFLLDFSSRL